jgi:outer membrane protein OmpA-like peptidoglycan-associated protein/tetratricopeptide (TPR) repeat protein
MSIRIAYLLFAFLCLAVSLQAQEYTTLDNTNRKARKAYESGRKLLPVNNYKTALIFFGEAIEADSLLIDAYIQYASVAYDLGEYPKAEVAFEQALALSADYKSILWYQLAVTEWRLNKFDEAHEHFQRYLDTNPKSGRQRELTLEYLDKTRFAAQAMRNPVPFEPIKLGPEINTDRAEYLPSLTADGNTMVYTTVIDGQEDFYVSYKVDGRWTQGVPMEEVNTTDNEGAQNISADGRLLVFTACNRRGGLGSCDLYYSEFRNGHWTPTRNMGAPVNSSAWDSQPSLSSNGRELYFASSRPGGLGGKDLWMSTRNDDGSWNEPINLGERINTPGNEQSPFLHPSGDVLYFMSDTHPGMGGFDIFYTRRQPDGAWGEPINLGYPINSTDNEGGLVVSLDGTTAYFATDRDLSNIGGPSSFDRIQSRRTTDIYMFELYPEARPSPATYVRAKVYDEQTRQPLQAGIEFTRLPDASPWVEASTDEKGEFLVVLPQGYDYSLSVSHPGYFFHSENFALLDQADLHDPYQLDIGLVPIPKELSASSGRTIVLKNIFFETARARLLPESIYELEKLRRLLEEYPNLRIEIHGHTDSVGTAESNQVLSEQRARAVHDYLITNGIDAKRLRTRGFGEERPIDTNDTPEGRQNNRRTEFMVF